MSKDLKEVNPETVGDYPLLSEIGSPADLRRLPVESLPALCGEIRKYLINSLAVNPGHFGSSMGAVELIVAMHYVFDTPEDRIVFDVGHQAYAHKLLTGRFKAFENQRKKGGISGFPFPAESEYDSFVCGHAGNSISAALGMAIADSHTPGREHRKTVALIGDASISGGLAFEGLNNASQSPNNLLIILNDNDMSIDNNVGALHRYLSDISTSERYNRVRFKVYNMFKKRGWIHEKGKGLMLRFNNSLKSLVAKQQNIFEGLNIRYFGPFNGNDVTKMVKVLQDIKNMQGPRILHVHTVKGKGFEAAEENPGKWHAPGKFDPVSAQLQSDVKKDVLPKWQDVFGETLVELADGNPDIVGITAGMASGTSICKMSKYPDRMFDVGISEGHAVTFAGGLAAGGKRPFVAIYSSFLQRGFDNIIHDVAIQGLPVTFCIDRAGLVGEDGVTHHGLFDIPYLRIIPGLTVAAPMDSTTLRNLMYTSLKGNSPFAIRYPRGKADVQNWRTPMETLTVGRGRCLTSTEGAKIAILTVGPVGAEASKAVNALFSQGIAVDHYDMIWIKPLDTDILEHVAGVYDAVITIEDGMLTGGFGSAVGEWLESNRKRIRLKSLGVPDRWIFQGTVPELMRECGFDAQAIENAVKDLISSCSEQIAAVQHLI